MPAETEKLYRGGCAADPVHADALAAVFARLDATGVAYDRGEIANPWAVRYAGAVSYRASKRPPLRLGIRHLFDPG
jgi:hypothetical protein